jgi:hypothetical protein
MPTDIYVAGAARAQREAHVDSAQAPLCMLLKPTKLEQ